MSSLANDRVLGQITLVLAGSSSLAAFLAGAATSSMLINWGRRWDAQSVYATPLMLEAVLLLCFGLLGSDTGRHRVLFVSATAGVLCFVMGLQNAIITKISRADIRTTHVTDIEIELGKPFYWNASSSDAPEVHADRPKLALLASLLAMFCVGGFTGAVGFKYLGFISTLPLAAVLVTLAAVPILDDIVRAPR